MRLVLGRVGAFWFQDCQRISSNTKCAMCIGASHPLAPRSLLPLHAIHHDLAALGRPVVGLVPLEGDPSQLPTHAPHSATTTPKLGRFPNKFDLFLVPANFFARSFGCSSFRHGGSDGPKNGRKKRETGPRNAAAPAARSGQGGRSRGGGGRDAPSPWRLSPNSGHRTCSR